MNRRDLLKFGIVASVAGLATKYVTEQTYSKNHTDKQIIQPKQTGTYEISTVLPYEYYLIDELVKFNKKYKKSKITTLYNNIPLPFFNHFNEHFQAYRGYSENIKNFDDFTSYVKYAKNLGFKFIYILNSPKTFSEEDYMEHKEELFHLFKLLKNIGCDGIKIANTQLMTIVSENTDFKLEASTSFEYHNLSQYKSLIETYPKTEGINFSIDDNRNFLLLKEFKKMFPKVKAELIVNEACLRGCPARISHPSSFFCVWDCISYRKKIGYLESFCRSNLIYPWQIIYYSTIGVNNFKFIGDRTKYDMGFAYFLNSYWSCVENGIENMTANDFFNDIYMVDVKFPDKLKLSEIIEYFPDINHFIQHGSECASVCDSSCTYCIECAKKLKKFTV